MRSGSWRGEGMQRREHWIQSGLPTESVVGQAHRPAAASQAATADSFLYSFAFSSRTLDRSGIRSWYSVSLMPRLVVICSATVALAVLFAASPQAGGQHPSARPNDQDWPVYLGDKAATHYSTLNQVNKENVSRLRAAWSHDTGDRGEFQSNGLIIGGVLYTASSSRKVIALNAATGKHIWTFDPAEVRPGNQGRRQRGVVYWASGSDRRILTGSGTYLYALNADTGKLIRSFGRNGSIHLGEGVETYGREGSHSVIINTPGVIYKDLYIVGGLTSGPGTIRAYNVRTGEMKWIFYTI